MQPSRDIDRLHRDHGGAQDAGDRLPVGPRADLRYHRSLHDRGSLRGRRRDRARRRRRSARRARRPAAAGRLPCPHGGGGRHASTSATSSRRSPRKLIRRHPHVFGDARDLSRDEVKALWGDIKAEEKRERAAARRVRTAPRGDGRARRRAARPARADPRAQASGKGRQGRLRLERPARRARQAARGNRRSRGRARRRRRAEASRAKSATSCSRSPISPATSASIRKRRCAAPTPSSSAASPISKDGSARLAAPRRARPSTRWRRCGAKPSNSKVSRGSDDVLRADAYLSFQPSERRRAQRAGLGLARPTARGRLDNAQLARRDQACGDGRSATARASTDPLERRVGGLCAAHPPA